jgi:hypothetical protein
MVMRRSPRSLRQAQNGSDCLALSRAFVKDAFCARCACVLLILCCVFSLLGRAAAAPTPPSPNEIHIPRGRAIVVDGVKSAAEWDDASVTQFVVAPGWNVRVFATHDAQFLYFDFEGMTHGGNRLFPEIVVDSHDTLLPASQKGQWWLHVSNNLCEGNGAPNVYEKKGKLQCARRKAGWDANNPPDERTELVEVKISFVKLGVEFAPGMKVGLAFDVTDASGKADQKWHFWPAGAKIDSPKTWGIAIGNESAG